MPNSDTQTLIAALARLVSAFSVMRPRTNFAGLSQTILK